MAPKRNSTAGKGGGDDDRVHVVVRIRPPVRKDEKFGEGSEALQYDAEKNLLFLMTKDEEKGKEDTKQFVFDKVLWKDSQQKDAWEHAGKGMVNATLEGFTSCVMCYGQTGAGKSFTLANEAKGQEGIMIAAFHHIFETAAESKDLKYEVAISYQQIYLDTITDLLNPGGNVEIREDPKTGVYVENATWTKCNSAAEAIKVIQKGNSNRATTATKMNSASSRSHAAVIARVTVTGGVRTLNGQLYLVDLAGSERVKKSGVEGAALDEAKAINQSLTTLGRCIEVLASGKKEKPPFREQKLTRLLSNAIGGGAKTTLVICCAPTMTDQFETIGSLDFGQQAMNVVVRAKVNASTDFGSLTASLLQQRDKKSKAIRELETKVLSELAPTLDEVINLEIECRDAAMRVDLLQDDVKAHKERLKQLEKDAEYEAEADKGAMVDLMNERSSAAQALEQVLVSLSSDPEIKKAQEEHEEEKAGLLKRSLELQEELKTQELSAKNETSGFDERLDGVVQTARNLGQMAAYFMQTKQQQEAADFYMQAKAMFDTLLGPDHPKTQAWMEDLFFLINAPAIQKLVTASQDDLKGAVESQQGANGSDTASDSTLRELIEMGVNFGDGDGDGDGAYNNWWMRDLYSADDKAGAKGAAKGGDDDEDNADFMQVLFGTPRGDGAPAFTPRGTLVALSEVNGNKGATIALGKPLQKQSGIPEDQQVDDATINMDFAKDWIQRIFETPRERVGDKDIEAGKNDAFRWLQENFGPGANSIHSSRGHGDADSENRPPVLA